MRSALTRVFRHPIARRAGPLVVCGLLAACPAHAANLLGLLDTGELYSSADAGVTWTVQSALPVRDAIGLVAGTSSSHLWLVSERGVFYESVDDGANWAAISSVPASDVAALVASPTELLLLTRTGSVYASLDEGANWSAVGTIPTANLVGGTQSGGTHYALTATGTVYESTDGGSGWAAVGTIPISNAAGIAVLNGSLWVLTGTGELARSDDAGANWTFVSTLSQIGMTSLLAVDGELVASAASGEVAATGDGISWSWRGTINQLAVRALASDVPVVTAVPPGSVSQLAFSAPWPNPASGRVSWALELAEPTVIHLDVFDAAGRLVASPIARQTLPAGRSLHSWSPGGLTPGMYLLRASAGDAVRVRRLIWIGR